MILIIVVFTEIIKVLPMIIIFIIIMDVIIFDIYSIGTEKTDLTKRVNVENAIRPWDSAYTNNRNGETPNV